MKLKPTGTNVIIIKDTRNTEETTTGSGIILQTPVNVGSLLNGVVYAVGKDATSIKKKSTVYFNRHSANEVTIDTVTYYVIDESDIRFTVRLTVDN